MSEETYLELEYKFAAENVDEQAFRCAMMEANPTKFSNFQHQDTFWQRSERVVRHRIKGDGSMELTIKKRTDLGSLVKREEVNLGLSPRATEDDVAVFLGAAGFRPLFTLKKDYIDLFTFDRAGYEMEGALYTVRRVDDFATARKFLELEIKPKTEKDPLMVLGYWRDWVTQKLGLDPPLNLSLFEFYSQPSNAIGTNYRI